MRAIVAGAAGFIGSHILTELLEHGHEVTAPVRDGAQGDVVADRGATPVVVDLYDRPAVVGLLGSADGAIHTASPGDESSADLDAAIVDAAIEGFAGTGKPWIQISGLWIYGENPSISEQSPINAPAMVAWKEPIENRILDARDLRGVELDRLAHANEGRADCREHEEGDGQPGGRDAGVAGADAGHPAGRGGPGGPPSGGAVGAGG